MALSPLSKALILLSERISKAQLISDRSLVLSTRNEVMLADHLQIIYKVTMGTF